MPYKRKGTLFLGAKAFCAIKPVSLDILYELSTHPAPVAHIYITGRQYTCIGKKSVRVFTPCLKTSVLLASCPFELWHTSTIKGTEHDGSSDERARKRLERRPGNVLAQTSPPDRSHLLGIVLIEAFSNVTSTNFTNCSHPGGKCLHKKARKIDVCLLVKFLNAVPTPTINRQIISRRQFITCFARSLLFNLYRKDARVFARCAIAVLNESYITWTCIPPCATTPCRARNVCHVRKWNEIQRAIRAAPKKNNGRRGLV